MRCRGRAALTQPHSFSLSHRVVALTARVDSDGTVRTVRVVSGNRALAAAAVRAVRQWRYRPYLQDGQPIATETNIAISFSQTTRFP